MAYRIQIFDFNTEAFNDRNSNNMRHNYPAGSSNFNAMRGFKRVYPYSQCAFHGNHRAGGASIHNQFDKGRLPFISQFGIAENIAGRSIESKFSHKTQVYLKSRRVSLGEGILRTLYQQIISLLKRKKLAIDFISMRAVREESSRDRRGGRFINFVYLDKKPFTMKPFFNCFNVFAFHDNHLKINDSRGCYGSQDVCERQK